MRTVKTNIYLLVTVALIAVVSSDCSQFFSPEDHSISQLLTSEDYESAINGVYDLSDIVINYGYTNVDDFADDNNPNVNNLAYNKCYNINKCDIHKYIDDDKKENYKSYEIWENTYKLITSINNILVQYENRKLHEDRIDQIAGEMYFLRAFCYFRLVRIYNELPVISDTDVDYTIKKSKGEEVYQFIINDLTTAKKLLPPNKMQCRIPNITPHKGTAKALLAEVYLSGAGYPVYKSEYYDLAAQEAEEVIDNATNFGFGLLSNFEDLWNNRNQFNSEDVLCYYHNRTAHSSVFSMYFVNLEKSNLNYEFINLNKLYIDKENFILNFQTGFPEINFYNNYPDSYRKRITFFSEVYIPTWYSNNSANLDTGIQFINKIEPCNRVIYRKFVLDSIIIPYETLELTNILYIKKYEVWGTPKSYLLRYAKTLLTYAEATARSGNITPLAYECVNQIRRRTHQLPLETPSEYDLQPGLSPEAFADSVFAERGWEFAGEPEGRWYDLLRMKRAGEIFANRDPQEGWLEFDPFTDEDYFRPIPEEDINLNSRLEE